MVLASASPRRQALIALLELPSRVAPADVAEEDFLLAEPLAAAVNVAVAKARATATMSDGEIVIAADTLVVIDRQILAKPGSPDEARTMLDQLRGREHHVLTGVVVQSSGLEWAGAVDTGIAMRNYTAEEAEAYIARGEPFDKAGGYAIQDETFRPVERIDGCYLNVVGLPLCAVAAGLNAIGIAAPGAGPAPCVYCKRGASLVRSGS